MKKSSFVLASFMGAGIAALSGAAIFVWNVDRQWSGVLKERIQEERSRSSVRVLVKESETQENRWLGSITGGRLEDRKPLRLSEIPPSLIQSIVSVEDPRFLNHEGFDGTGILRAFWTNLKELRYAQGGSTITQQLVKNVFLSNEKTIRRKLTEIILAALVEKKFSKDEILEAYLNEVYFAQLGPIGVHGVARGAEYYFSKDIQKIELHEAALLAALVKGPGYYSPWRYPDRALARRNFVLSRVLERDLILKEEYEAAILKPLPAPRTFMAPLRAPYVMDALRLQLLNEYGESYLLSNILDLSISLDLQLQESAEKILREVSANWENAQQAILFAARPKDCSILAYVGGTQYSITQLDHIRQMERAPGSLLKPLLISPLLDSGDLSLTSEFDDQPLTWDFDKGRGTWSPQNFDRKFRGKVRLRQILEESLNVPFVRLFFEREPSGLLWSELDPLRSLGLKTPQDRAFPSALLGAIEQSPWRIMEAYLKLTRRSLGLAHNAADPDCRLKFESPDSIGDEDVPSLAYGETGARLTIAALEGALRQGTSKSLGARLPRDQAWAGKTGTSSDRKDAWYVLLSPEIVMLSWVGRDDNKETSFTGSSGALPLISSWIQANNNDSEEWNWPLPENVEWHSYDSENDCIKNEDESELKELFATHALPKKCVEEL